MEITPQDVQQKQFDQVKRGFDPQQVGVFLDQVAATLAKRDRALDVAQAEIEALRRVDADGAQNQEAFRQTLDVATETMEEMLRMAGERAAAIEEEAKGAAEFLVERAMVDAEDRVASVRRELKTLEGERARIESQIAGLRESSPDDQATLDAGASDQQATGRRALELVVDRAQDGDGDDGSGLAARVGDFRG